MSEQPSDKIQVFLVEQSAWRSSEGASPSMPLASGYLKAVVLADVELDRRYDVTIHSFAGYESIPELAKALFSGRLPDVMAFSVLGWNIRTAERLSSIYRQLRPEGWVVWGGNHVSGQGDLILRRNPDVDVIVNGEGEITWACLLRERARGVSRHDLASIDGLSFRAAGGEVITTKDRARIENLDEIPSPFLTGALKLTGEDGKPLYSDALMETNRGCPYKCAFCYWGGAIGQRVRQFSSERLAQEVELIAKAGYARLSLCDANFGMLPDDEQFLEVCIDAKKKHGYPQYFFTSWAKNKSQAFHRILRRMSQARLTSTFNVALQTLSTPALKLMNRQNMRLNQWEPLVEQLKLDGLDLYAELIWGIPGDDKESFLAAYDRLSASVPQVAVYPLLIMPNTDYWNRKKELGLVTFKSDLHDFELVLSHPNMSADDNREMHRFLFWARLLGEQAFFRAVWAPLRELAGVLPTQVLWSLDRYMDRESRGLAVKLRRLRGEVQARLETDEELLDQALNVLYGDPEIDDCLLAWWTAELEPKIPEAHRDFLRDVFRLDLLTRPRYGAAPAGQDAAPGSFRREILRGVTFAHDVVEHLSRPLNRAAPVPRAETRYNITFLFLLQRGQRLFYEARNKMYFGRARKAPRDADRSKEAAA
ncbi:MAG: KedN5 family methylcobalamin-dependent radical SAM C-methyltransferase [Kofleriaceae bacterium]